MSAFIEICVSLLTMVTAEYLNRILPVDEQPHDQNRASLVLLHEEFVPSATQD